MPRLSSAGSIAIGHAALYDRWQQPRRPMEVPQADRASAEAWTIFWQEQGAGSRCGINAPSDMRAALDSHWREFASTLPPAATVLDIGCGAGAVGQDLLSWRPGLCITGIDIASVPSDPRMELLPDTPMESLPFADRCFGAVVSQFGFEYGRVSEAAREIARVLIPHAPLSFLVHHSDGPIIADCKRHRRALEQLTGAPLRAAFMSGTPAALEHVFSIIRRDCPGERIVEQAARGLAIRITGDVAERAAVWDAVVDALAPEQVMAKALEASCVAPGDLKRWLEPLMEAFELKTPSVLRIGAGGPLAWKIEGRRR
jgi:ubiquinone/menaquinone biosynthesis C-methylase UbiE